MPDGVDRPAGGPHRHVVYRRLGHDGPAEESPRQTRCTWCKASAGNPCTVPVGTKGARKEVTWFHHARWEAMRRGD